MTKQELLQSINLSWEQLTAALERLSAEQLTALKDEQGWAVKDHVAHLTAWERSVISLLQGKDRYHGLAVAERTFLSHDYDKINDQIYQRSKNLSWVAIIKQFRSAHEELLGRIQILTDEQLQKPSRQYRPANSKDEDDRPLIDVIRANTTGHFAEHQDWIEALAQK